MLEKLKRKELQIYIGHCFVFFLYDFLRLNLNDFGGTFLVFFTMITRAFCGRFKCNISWATNTVKHHVYIFCFHNVATLTDWRNRFWYFWTICNKWCWWNSIWFTVAPACIRIDWKLNTVRNFNFSTMTCWNDVKRSGTKWKIEKLKNQFFIKYNQSISQNLPTLWQPGRCHIISFDVTVVAQMVIRANWIHVAIAFLFFR